MTHLVLIETASNQRYIFASNVFREALGASRLIADVGQVLFPRFVKEEGGEILLAASGKGMAFVPGAEAGPRIVQAVCRAALESVPGLRVYGAVVEIDGETAGALDTSIGDVHRRLASLRGRLGEAETGLMLPIAEPCNSTGVAAAGFDGARWTPEDQRTVPLSAAVIAKRNRRSKELTDIREGRDTFHDFLTDMGKGRRATLKSDDESADWLAVIHADGNNLGNTFQHLRTLGGIGDEAPAASYAETYAAFSSALDECCKGAARDALKAVWSAADEPTGVFFRPLVIAGDDLTVVCEGRHAVAFTRAFLMAFAERTAGHGDIRKICKGGISAGAGIAVVKPHFPFHRACDLAEELAKGAKDAAKRADPNDPPGALDFRVVLDGAFDADHAIETAQGATVRGGPYGTGAGLRSLADLQRACDALCSGALPRGQQHALREAAVRGPDAARSAVALIKHRYPCFDWPSVTGEDDTLFADGKTFFLDALSLVQLDRGGASEPPERKT